MIIKETSLNGAFIIDIEPIEDERGFFARTWCKREFEKYNLCNQFVQCNISYNRKKGTIRGMHYQAPPYEEVKIVNCVRGSIYDVIIDLRLTSKTYLHWEAFNLSAKNRKMLYIPKGFAHGFQTLEDDTEILYQMSDFFHPESSSGIRWDDPSFNIKWPIVHNYIISKKDRSWKDYYETINNYGC